MLLVLVVLLRDVVLGTLLVCVMDSRVVMLLCVVLLGDVVLETLLA